MVPPRFPFSVPQPPNPPISTSAAASTFSTSAAAGTFSSYAAAGAGVTIWQNIDSQFLQNALNLLGTNFTHGGIRPNPLWGSLSISVNSSPVTESRTAMSFPAVLRDSQRLLGVGCRKSNSWATAAACVVGLKVLELT